ncbi:Copper transport protein [Abortiporus biennis]
MSNSTSTATITMMMVPWLHFTGGDNLFFKSWHPSSHGAIAGACIGLVVLAILERWISGMRGLLESHWRRKTLAIIGSQCGSSTSVKAASPLPSNAKDDNIDISQDDVKSVSDTPKLTVVTRVTPRALPPFIARHDLPRGAIFALQTLFGYILMLAVMTFQAAYLISIVAGLGIGEMLFGRLGSSMLH